MSGRRTRGEPPNCVYSAGVGCRWGDRPPGQREHCEKCGWNPKVTRARAEQRRAELAEHWEGATGNGSGG